MGIVRVWSWSSREEFLVPGLGFRVYSLRFRDVSWSHRVHKSAARRVIYAQVCENDARGSEIRMQRRRNDADMREIKKPTDGELLSIF